jgi:myosin heavy subunit
MDCAECSKAAAELDAAKEFVREEKRRKLEEREAKKAEMVQEKRRKLEEREAKKAERVQGKRRKLEDRGAQTAEAARKAEEHKRAAEHKRRLAAEQQRLLAEAREEHKRQLAVEQQRLLAEARERMCAGTAAAAAASSSSSSSSQQPQPQPAELAALPALDSMPIDQLVQHVLRCSPNAPHLCLGVARGADESTVRKKFRALALRLHPDKLTHPEAVRAFAKLTDALERCLLMCSSCN